MSVWKVPFVDSVTSTPNIWVSLAMSAARLMPCWPTRSSSSHHRKKASTPAVARGSSSICRTTPFRSPVVLIDAATVAH